MGRQGLRGRSATKLGRREGKKKWNLYNYYVSLSSLITITISSIYQKLERVSIDSRKKYRQFVSHLVSFFFSSCPSEATLYACKEFRRDIKIIELSNLHLRIQRAATHARVRAHALLKAQRKMIKSVKRVRRFSVKPRSCESTLMR